MRMKLVCARFGEYETELSYIGQSLWFEPFHFSLGISRNLEAFRKNSHGTDTKDKISYHNKSPQELFQNVRVLLYFGGYCVFVLLMGCMIFILSFFYQVSLPTLKLTVIVDSIEAGIIQIQKLKCGTVLIKNNKPQKQNTKSYDNNLGNLSFNDSVATILEPIKSMFIHVLQSEFHVESRCNISVNSSFFKLSGQDIVVKDAFALNQLCYSLMELFNNATRIVLIHIFPSDQEWASSISSTFDSTCSLISTLLFRVSHETYETSRLSYRSIKNISIEIDPSGNIPASLYLFGKDSLDLLFHHFFVKQKAAPGQYLNKDSYFSRHVISEKWVFLLVHIKACDVEFIGKDVQCSRNSTTSLLPHSYDEFIVTITELDVVRLDSLNLYDSISIDNEGFSEESTIILHRGKRVLRPIIYCHNIYCCIHFNLQASQMAAAKRGTFEIETINCCINKLFMHQPSLYHLFPSKSFLLLISWYIRRYGNKSLTFCKQ